MGLMLIFGVGLAGVAVALAVRGIALSRTRAAETVGKIGAYGFARKEQESQANTDTTGPLDRMAGRFGALFGDRFSPEQEGEMRMQLMAAGLYRLQPRKFLGYRIICALAVPAVVLWLLSTAGLPRGLIIVGALLSFVAGWQLPLTVVKRRAQRRSDQVDYELPELIDLLVVTVEAGLGFTRALQVASERLQGPLADEVGLALQQQSMGMSSIEALRSILDRCDTPMMRSFVRSVVQGEALGVSIGDIMRNLAEEMRKRRRQEAEERAQKAPVKMLFPLIFLIFPAMFLVILGPALYTFLDALSG